VSAWRLRKFTTCRSTGGLQPNYPNDHEDRGSLGFWRIDSGRVQEARLDYRLYVFLVRYSPRRGMLSR